VLNRIYPPSIWFVVFHIFVFGCRINIPKEDFSKRELFFSDLNQPFDIKLNQSIYIKSENLEIEFLEVMEDSRCPVSSICKWEGQAIVLLRLQSSDNHSSKINLTQRKGHPDLAVGKINEYQIKLNMINPYPTLKEKINISDYKLNLTIHKN